MSASTKSIPVIVCDKCSEEFGCAVNYDVISSMEEAREDAAKYHEWTHTDGKDYCDECSAVRASSK